MFYIKGLEDNIIDLDGVKEYMEEFEVVSLNNKGKRQPFQIELITNENIRVSSFEVNFLRIEITPQMIVNEEHIVLKNYIGEKIIITVKANEYFTNEIKYKFKITKTEFKKNGDLRVKILSKANGEEIGWKCTHDGSPLSYEITPKEDEKSSFITIKSLTNLLIDYTSVLIFEQEESGEIIKLEIYNTPDGMKKADY